MYNHKEIEKKWLNFWEQNKIYKCENSKSTTKPKFYTLVEFPYPSWVWLHMWHVKGQTAVDVFARYKRMNWYNVLNCMWWDAFWLPAENFAIKNKKHPWVVTKENIQNFVKQTKAFGPSFDWDREIDTTDPKYYKWTQWIFLELFKAWLAYEKKAPINWCPSCKTGLANEEVIDSKCERCDSEVEQKLMKQWFLAITKYADKLEKDLSDLNWPEYIKTSQKNWIGKSEGCEFEMKKSDDENKKVSVFTTRIDTVFGMTYVVLAPDHPQVLDFITDNEKENCLKYIDESKNKSALERTELNKEKTWVFSWSYVINPFNNEKVPLWIWDYVLGNYWTWAVMAVPSHDERDFEFTKKYDLEIKQSIAYLFESEKDKPKEYTETIKRKNVIWILKNNKNNKIFVLDWEKFWWKSFVVWWVNEWETLEEALIREIKEETWYQNIKITKKLWWEIHANYFAHHKNINRYSIDNTFLVELIDDEYIKPDEKETKNHKWFWIDEKDLYDFINLENHKIPLDIYKNWEKAFTNDWILVNSWEFDWLKSEEARKKLTEFATENWFWKKVSNYKLRDWLFSRQRYRWEPIPLIHLQIEDLKKLPHITDIKEIKDKNLAYILKREPNPWEKACNNTTCNWKIRELIIWWKIFSKIYDSIDSKIVVDEKLPLELPEIKDYEPSWDWQSPLAKIDSFVNIKLADNLTWKRETNTMPQWAWSSWYFLRYIDPKNDMKFASKENLKYFMPVDIYFGWAEHTTVHLLYSRFWNKALYDLWIVPLSEPYKRRVQHGLIMWTDWRKMSKRWWNVINPDDIIEKYWADSMRAYVMFMWPYWDSVPWNDSAIAWINRFINKLYSLSEKIIQKDDTQTIKLLHKTIKKITQDIENISYNTAISSAMIFVNHSINTWITKESLIKFLQIISPFIPFITEEIYSKLNSNSKSIHLTSWPKYDEELIKEEEIIIWIQVNWKLRWEIKININDSKENIISKAKNLESIKKWISWKEIIKEIYIPWKIVNIVIK